MYIMAVPVGDMARWWWWWRWFKNKMPRTAVSDMSWVEQDLAFPSAALPP